MADATTEADGEESNGSSAQSGSGLKMLLLLGFSFIAGYLFAKSKGSKPNLHEELGELGRSGGPMEIEIEDMDNSSAADEDEDTDEEWDVEEDEAEKEIEAQTEDEEEDESEESDSSAADEDSESNDTDDEA
ncbi:hypothetical protein [Haladaptatus pallidirubidus]|uniref:Uncharacterized protein n=1 Tax=Haladaptatus pallidirubidus TaxID=1008152 RepID=A0AAV3UN65_9EURY|nr:hypothetical protein [Haladaptatus pallidirubidus]